MHGVDIAAAMDDSQDENAPSFHAVHHTVALHENFADGLVVGFRYPAADEGELASLSVRSNTRSVNSRA
jgi:hypothetical protein